jgi:hypothetical protein
MVMPREPMCPPMKTLPWAMALQVPLEALPLTTISAPAHSQPVSSEAGPSETMVVPGKPMDPRR